METTVVNSEDSSEDCSAKVEKAHFSKGSGLGNYFINFLQLENRGDLCISD